MSDVRIVLVDDHEMIRAGLRSIIDAEPDLAVVGEAPDAWVKVNIQPTRFTPRCFVLRIGPTVFPHPKTCSTHFRFL